MAGRRHSRRARRNGVWASNDPWSDVDTVGLGLALSMWHGGQRSSLYAVCSSLLAGREQNLGMEDVEGALDELGRAIRFRVTEEQRNELQGLMTELMDVRDRMMELA